MRTSGHLWYVLNTYQTTKYQKSNVLSLTRFENTNCVTMSENRYNSRSDVNIIDCIIFNVGRRFERGFIQSQIWCKNHWKSMEIRTNSDVWSISVQDIITYWLKIEYWCVYSLFKMIITGRRFERLPSHIQFVYDLQ